MNAAEKKEIEAMFRQQADAMVGKLDASFKAHVDTLRGDFKAHVAQVMARNERDFGLMQGGTRWQ